MKTTLKIAGMGCEHCVKRVTKALEELPGVKNIRVSLERAEASFEKPEALSLEDVIRTIEAAGYQVEKT